MHRILASGAFRAGRRSEVIFDFDRHAGFAGFDGGKAGLDGLCALNGSGVNGRKFTSKINGNSIFIPASGVRSGSAFCYQGIFSHVWSSSLVTESPSFAWNLYFNSGGISAHSTSARYFRFAVRGVTECR